MSKNNHATIIYCLETIVQNACYHGYRNDMIMQMYILWAGEILQRTVASQIYYVDVTSAVQTRRE